MPMSANRGEDRASAQPRKDSAIPRGSGPEFERPNENQTGSKPAPAPPSHIMPCF